MANALEQALENVYASLHNDNHEIDERIEELKTAMKSEDVKVATIEREKLAMNNREGRNTLKAYFKKRGVKVEFTKPA